MSFHVSVLYVLVGLLVHSGSCQCSSLLSCLNFCFSVFLLFYKQINDWLIDWVIINRRIMDQEELIKFWKVKVRDRVSVSDLLHAWRQWHWTEWRLNLSVCMLGCLCTKRNSTGCLSAASVDMACWVLTPFSLTFRHSLSVRRCEVIIERLYCFFYDSFPLSSSAPRNLTRRITKRIHSVGLRFVDSHRDRWPIRRTTRLPPRGRLCN